MSKRSEKNLKQIAILAKASLQIIQDKSNRILQHHDDIDSSVYDDVYIINQEAHKILKPMNDYISLDD